MTYRKKKQHYILSILHFENASHPYYHLISLRPTLLATARLLLAALAALVVLAALNPRRHLEPLGDHLKILLHAQGFNPLVLGQRLAQLLL